MATTGHNTTTKSVEQLFVSALETASANVKFSAESAQLNGSSKREYTKVNQLILVSSKALNGFSSNEWFTQDQIATAGLSIIKDSKGTMLFNSSIKEDETKTYEKDGETKNFKVKTYSYYYVFNKDQLEERTEA